MNDGPNSSECVVERFTQFTQFLLTQPGSELSVFLRESGDFLHVLLSPEQQPLLVPVFVKCDVFTVSVFYSLIHLV